MTTICYLFPKVLFNHKMHRIREMWGRELDSRENMRCKFWGPGWEGYNENKTVQQNIDMLHRTIDAVIVYGHEHMHGCRSITCPTILMFTDANHPHTQQTINSLRPDLIVFSHQQDVARWEIPGRSIVIPYGIDPHVYYHTLPIADRTTPCLFAGRHSYPTYKMRARLYSLLLAGQLPGRIRLHPGDKVDNPPKAWAQLFSYAEDLQSSRIFLTGCGKFGYAYQKYLEAIAAGCVVVGTMPTDPWFVQDFSDILVEVTHDMSDKEIIDIVKDTLDDVPAMQERVDRAQAMYLEKYTLEHYGDKLAAAIESLL